MGRSRLFDLFGISSATVSQTEDEQNTNPDFVHME